MKKEWYEFLGVKVNLLDISQLNSLITKAIKYDKKWIVANHNLNSLYIYHHNSVMRDFYQIADYIHIDGMSLILLGKLLGLPCAKEHRVTYADWVWPLMEESAKKSWRVLYLGSKPGIADKGASILRNIYPDLQIATLHGYFTFLSNDQENQSVIEKIREYQPHILMVGMGMPRQEKWILDNINKIRVNIILPSGACIDYVAGEISTPPRWMGKAGLEWLYRLLTEPKRLWRRYLVEPWFIAAIFFKQYFFFIHNSFFTKNVK